MSSDPSVLYKSTNTHSPLTVCQALIANTVLTPQALNPVGETEVLNTEGWKVEYILGCRLGLGKGMEVGKGF